MIFVIYSNGQPSGARYLEPKWVGSETSVKQTLAKCKSLEQTECGIEIHVAKSIWHYSEAEAIGQATILREQLENRYEMRLRRKA